MVRKLIITADDFGYSDYTNRGIIQCFKAGAITQSSVLVNGVCLENAVSLLNEHWPRVESQPCLGLHLNLSEGSPLSAPGNIPSLVNKDGYFLGKLGLHDAADEGRVDHDEVCEEVEKQLRRYVDVFGSTPAYLDGHQHVHICPVIVGAVAGVMSRHGIPWTRIPHQGALGDSSWVDEARRGFYTRVEGHAIRARQLYAQFGIRSSDGFVGLTTMGSDMTVERLTGAIRAAYHGTEAGGDGGDSVVEVMVHPGYPHPAHVARGGCGAGAHPFSTSQDRRWEMGVLACAEMGDFYTQHHLHLTNTRRLTLPQCKS